VTGDTGRTWAIDVLPDAGGGISTQWASFVTAQVGFALAPWSQAPFTVLLATGDGGTTWRQVAALRHTVRSRMPGVVGAGVKGSS
jgi:hypothetical protein